MPSAHRPSGFASKSAIAAGLGTTSGGTAKGNKLEKQFAAEIGVKLRDVESMMHEVFYKKTSGGKWVPKSKAEIDKKLAGPNGEELLNKIEEINIKWLTTWQLSKHVLDVQVDSRGKETVRALRGKIDSMIDEAQKTYFGGSIKFNDKMLEGPLNLKTATREEMADHIMSHRNMLESEYNVATADNPVLGEDNFKAYYKKLIDLLPGVAGGPGGSTGGRAGGRTGGSGRTTTYGEPGEVKIPADQTVSTDAIAKIKSAAGIALTESKARNNLKASGKAIVKATKEVSDAVKAMKSGSNWMVPDATKADALTGKIEARQGTLTNLRNGSCGKVGEVLETMIDEAIDDARVQSKPGKAKTAIRNMNVMYKGKQVSLSGKGLKMNAKGLEAVNQHIERTTQDLASTTTALENAVRARDAAVTAGNAKEQKKKDKEVKTLEGQVQAKNDEIRKFKVARKHIETMRELGGQQLINDNDPDYKALREARDAVIWRTGPNEPVGKSGAVVAIMEVYVSASKQPLGSVVSDMEKLRDLTANGTEKLTEKLKEIEAARRIPFINGNITGRKVLGRVVKQLQELSRTPEFENEVAGLVPAPIDEQVIKVGLLGGVHRHAEATA